MISLKKLFHLIDLARQCNKCAMLHFQNLSFNKVKYKNDNSPLTQADLEAVSYTHLTLPTSDLV